MTFLFNVLDLFFKLLIIRDEWLIIFLDWFLNSPSQPSPSRGRSLIFCSLPYSGRARVGSDSLRKIIAPHPHLSKAGEGVNALRYNVLPQADNMGYVNFY